MVGGGLIIRLVKALAHAGNVIRTCHARGQEMKVDFSLARGSI